MQVHEMVTISNLFIYFCIWTLIFVVCACVCVCMCPCMRVPENDFVAFFLFDVC